jgi:hypothetical protein
MNYLIPILLGYTLAIKLDHIDYYVDVTVGDKPLKLKLDTSKSTSVINYEGMNSTSRYVDNKQVVTDTIKLDEYSLNYTFLKGNDLTLGLGYKNKYGKEFSILDSLKAADVIFSKQFTISKYAIVFDDSIMPTGTCSVMSADDLDERYNEGWLCDLTYILTHDGNKVIDQIELDARVIFDYKSNYNRFPNKFKKYIIDGFRGKNYNCSENIYKTETKVNCQAKDFENTIYLALGNSAYRISSQLNDTHSELDIIFSDDEKVWVLGRPFLNSYTISYDADNGKIGISGGSIISMPKVTNWYDEFIQRAREYFYLIIISTIVICLILIIVICLIVRSYRRKRLEEHGPLINDRNN